MIGRMLLAAGLAFAGAGLATSPLYGTQWGVLSPLFSILSILCGLALAFVYRGRKYTQFKSSSKAIALAAFGCFVALVFVVSYFDLKTVGAPGHNYWQAVQLFLIECLLFAQLMMRKNPTSVS